MSLYLRVYDNDKYDNNVEKKVLKNKQKIKNI